MEKQVARPAVDDCAGVDDGVATDRFGVGPVNRHEAGVGEEDRTADAAGAKAAADFPAGPVQEAGREIERHCGAGDAAVRWSEAAAHLESSCRSR